MVEKVDFIKEDLIFSLLEKGKITDRNEIREILAKARECKGISLEKLQSCFTWKTKSCWKNSMMWPNI